MRKRFLVMPAKEEVGWVRGEFEGVVLEAEKLEEHDDFLLMKFRMPHDARDVNAGKLRRQPIRAGSPRNCQIRHLPRAVSSCILRAHLPGC
jgi:hypothetical protein